MTTGFSDLGRFEPPASAYVARAQALTPTIAERVDQIERERGLPAPLVETLIDAGFYRLLLPRSLGGAELDPVTFVRVIEEIARVDASTAWCLCQASGCSMVAAYLAPDVAREIFGPPTGILAWGPGPAARAIATDGGFRLTGTWSFASGGHQASWLGAHAPLYEPDGTPRRTASGSPVVRTMIFPASAATWTDIWNVIGLRGTGSDAYAVTDLFVPGERTLSRDDAAERRYHAPLYCFPSGSLYASGFAGVALGVARTVLDAFVELAHDKTPRGFTSTLRENAVVQSEVARCEARLRSSRAFLLGSLAEIWADVERSGALTLDARVLIRLASTWAIQQAKEVVDVAYHAAGATAIFATNGFERRVRDMHAITQQLQGRQSHFETVGRFVLGLDPDSAFL